MRSMALALSVVFGLAAGLPAVAQQAAPQTANVRGTIVKLAGETLTVKTRDGKTADVMLGQNTRLGALTRKKLSDIKDGDFVGITSVTGKDGKMHAVEIHYLPPNVPESQFPYDLRPNSLMTNAHVSGVIRAKTGNDISVSYKGTPAEFVVDRRTAINGPAPASLSDLKPRRAVSVRATMGSDGMWHAVSVTVEKNGVKPPM